MVSRNLHRLHRPFAGALATAITVFLDASLAFFCFFGSPAGLFSWGLPNFRFLIPLGHYISKRYTGHGPLEFAQWVLFFGFLPTVPFCVLFCRGQSSLSQQIPLGKECPLTSCIKRLKTLCMFPGLAPCVSRETLYPLKLHSSTFTTVAAGQKEGGEEKQDDLLLTNYLYNSPVSK